MSSKDLLKELYSKLTPEQFEKFLSVLLAQMGFEDVKVTGQSGDRGIDLEATWSQMNVPKLDVDLPFKIQAKRFSPDSSLNPRFVRELRGTLSPGNWGLLITTARVTSKTHEEGLGGDPSRVISVIGGDDLIDLCKNYEVGVRTDYKIDLSSLEKEESLEIMVGPEETIQQKLSKFLKEDFTRLGTSSIYQSKSKVVIARYSQHYDQPGINYWYATTGKDLERVERYEVTHFAFICADRGVALIPVDDVLMAISLGNLNKTTTKVGELRHYHIHLFEKDGSMYWRLKGENMKIDDLFFTGSYHKEMSKTLS